MHATKVSRVLLFWACSLLLVNSCAKEPDPEQLMKLADRYVAIWKGGSLDDADKILHPDFELRMTPDYKAVKGIEAFKQTVQSWRTAYPDFTLRIDETVNAEGAGFKRWTITGTNTGEGQHPPTGQKVDVQGMSILHFADGKIRDEWIAANNLLWMQQLGFTLQPPQPEPAPVEK